MFILELFWISHLNGSRGKKTSTFTDGLECAGPRAAAIGSSAHQRPLFAAKNALHAIRRYDEISRLCALPKNEYSTAQPATIILCANQSCGTGHDFDPQFAKECK